MPLALTGRVRRRGHRHANTDALIPSVSKEMRIRELGRVRERAHGLGVCHFACVSCCVLCCVVYGGALRGGVRWVLPHVHDKFMTAARTPLGIEVRRTATLYEQGLAVKPRSRSLERKLPVPPCDCHHVEASAAARAVNDQKDVQESVTLDWRFGGQEPNNTVLYRLRQYSQNKGGLGPNGARHEWGCCAPKHVDLVQQKVDVEPPADKTGKPPRRERSGHFKWHQSAYDGDQPAAFLVGGGVRGCRRRDRFKGYTSKSLRAIGDSSCHRPSSGAAIPPARRRRMAAGVIVVPADAIASARSASSPSPRRRHGI